MWSVFNTLSTNTNEHKTKSTAHDKNQICDHYSIRISIQDTHHEKDRKSCRSLQLIFINSFLVNTK